MKKNNNNNSSKLDRILKERHELQRMIGESEARIAGKTLVPDWEQSRLERLTWQLEKNTYEFNLLTNNGHSTRQSDFNLIVHNGCVSYKKTV